MSSFLRQHFDNYWVWIAVHHSICYMISLNGWWSKNDSELNECLMHNLRDFESPIPKKNCAKGSMSWMPPMSWMPSMSVACRTSEFMKNGSQKLLIVSNCVWKFRIPADKNRLSERGLALKGLKKLSVLFRKFCQNLKILYMVHLCSEISCLLTIAMNFSFEKLSKYHWSAKIYSLEKN